MCDRKERLHICVDEPQRIREECRCLCKTAPTPLRSGIAICTLPHFASLQSLPLDTFRTREELERMPVARLKALLAVCVCAALAPCLLSLFCAALLLAAAAA